MAKWEAEFNQLMNSQRGDLDYDYGSVMQEALESGLGNWSEPPASTGTKFDEQGLPILGDYEFGVYCMSLFSLSLIFCTYRNAEQLP